LNILLIRLRLIGDVVFTTPLLRALRRRFPDAHLSYLVEPLAADVVRGNPHLDEVIVAAAPDAPGRWRSDLTLVRRLRAGRFDIAVDLHGGPRAALFAWACGAPRRIGYAITGRSWVYTDVIPRASGLTPRHAVQNQWDLIAPLGVPDPDPASDAIEIPEDTQATGRVTTKLASLGFTSDDPLVVIHVSAGNPFRRWPADAFVAMAVRVATEGRQVVVISGPSDVLAASHIANAATQRLTGAGRVLSAAFDVAEIRALVSHAAVYIGGDSGPLHVASATATPIVALFGPTLVERSRPWRDPRWHTETIDAGPLPCRPCHQRTCEPGDYRCLTRIEPDRVADAAERALSHTVVAATIGTRA
jgi:lipopolysaccharide heptosyltransferase II